MLLRRHRPEWPSGSRPARPRHRRARRRAGRRVVSDLGMPGMDGAALLEQVSPGAPDGTARVLLSGLSAGELAGARSVAHVRPEAVRHADALRRDRADARRLTLLSERTRRRRAPRPPASGGRRRPAPPRARAAWVARATGSRALPPRVRRTGTRSTPPATAAALARPARRSEGTRGYRRKAGSSSPGSGTRAVPSRSAADPLAARRTASTAV